jgi:hypothetical protein
MAFEQGIGFVHLGDTAFRFMKPFMKVSPKNRL